METSGSLRRPTGGARSRSGHDFAYGLHLSVLCAEDVQFVSDADVTAAAADTVLQMLISGALDGLPDVCHEQR